MQETDNALDRRLDARTSRVFALSHGDWSFELEVIEAAEGLDHPHSVNRPEKLLHRFGNVEKFVGLGDVFDHLVNRAGLIFHRTDIDHTSKALVPLYIVDMREGVTLP